MTISRQSGSNRQQDVHGGASAEFAFEGETAAMPLDDVLHDGKSQAGPTKRTAAAGVDAIEALGQALQMLRRNSLAVIGYASHALLFPRAAAVIHHGGIGTTAQALRAGAPQLVCPVLGDQFDNADRLRRLGVATVVPLKRYTTARAEVALQDTLADSAACARTLSPETSRIDGPTVVADWIAERFATQS